MRAHGYSEDGGIKHRERIPWYRARVERDHAARLGNYREWMRAEARVRELAPKEGA